LITICILSPCRLSHIIRARAIRRAGEVLKTFDGKGRNQYSEGNHGSEITQKQAATDAGFSRRQKDTAINIANIPENEFETALKSNLQTHKSGKYAHIIASLLARRYFSAHTAIID
jgi:hypothetical protein